MIEYIKRLRIRDTAKDYHLFTIKDCDLTIGYDLRPQDKAQMIIFALISLSNVCNITSSYL
jgi:hypothetical protein